MDCLFCKIIAGNIPNYTVYEDDNVLAFLDIHPCSKGHTVVIPKQHFAVLSEMDASQWATTMAGLQKAISKVYGVLAPQGLNIGINDGAAAGQAVGHVHWHIIPRYTGDGGKSMHAIIRSPEVGDVGEISQLFKS